MLSEAAAITAAIQLCGFSIAYSLTTEVFYDILGGLNFLILGIYSAIHGQSSGHIWVEDYRKVSCTLIFLCSRLWLLIFLAWRAHERGGDSRFDNVKENFSLFLIYWTVQGIWVFTISLPVIFVNTSAPSPIEFSVVEYTTIIGFGLGVILEVLADLQKCIWVKSGRQGKFCQVGLWKYSRHPNYFGEMLQWWSVWVFSYSSGAGFGDIRWWIGILSPLFTMHLLLFTGGTGVANANGKGLKRYYDECPQEYAEYRKSTSILIPMVGYKHVPMFLKRTIFLDFKRYEYQPKHVHSGGMVADTDKKNI